MKYIAVSGSPDKLPLIAEVDFLVAGGGLFGVAAARAAAQRRKKVMLVESGTFLGFQITRWNRPWVKWQRARAETVKTWLPFRLGGRKPVEGEVVPLVPDRIKLRLENLLLESKVDLLYGSRVLGLQQERAGSLLVLGNKTGRQAVRARHVLDDTFNGCLDWLARGDASPLSVQEREDCRRRLICRRTLEFTGVDPSRLAVYEMPTALEVHQDRVDVYPGAADAGHVYVDIPLMVETAAGRNLRADARLEFTAREKSLQVAEYLIQRVPAFSKARIGFGSCQVMLDDSFDPAQALAEGEEAGKEVAAGKAGLLMIRRSPSLGEAETIAAGEASAGPALKVSQDADFVLKRGYPLVPDPVGRLPLAAEADVLVAGGGTSGAPAARAAAREGVDTVLVEMNHSLGGTGTVGAVNAYWYSRRCEFSNEIDRAVKAVENRLKHLEEPVPCEGYLINQKWSYEVKSQVLWRMSREAGVEVFFDCLTVGTLMRGNRIAGLALATPYGPGAVSGLVTVDATGDGDVAWHAGGEHVYGNDRDAMTMWCSLGRYGKPASTSGNFEGTADIGNVFDYTRAILVGRRRGGNLHDHATYLAPRETRHILGDVLLTMEDQMKLRRFPDTIAICYSNHDIKGLSAADLVYFGLLPPNVDIEIPYRAVLPKNLEGLLIAGKAFSCTHDALAAPRMQIDLQNLGGAVGLAAALSARRKVAPRRLNVKELQKRLQKMRAVVRIGGSGKAKAERALHDAVARIDPKEGELWGRQKWTQKLSAPQPGTLAFYADSKNAVAVLNLAYAKAKGEKRLFLARLLIRHGETGPLPEVLAEIEGMLGKSGPLPARKGSLLNTVVPPDQGAMPELAFLLNGLGHTRDPRVVEILRQVVKRICASKRNYADRRAGWFYYIYSVAYVAERLGLRECAPLLEKLLRLPEFKVPVRRKGLEVDFLEERRSYLPLVLARALTRCGRKRGLLLLADFLNDNRGVLAQSARRELKGIMRQDHGYLAERWLKVIRRLPDNIPPQPWARRLD